MSIRDVTDLAAQEALKLAHFAIVVSVLLA